MNKTDKETLYNLLGTSQSYFNGFRDNSVNMPIFADDMTQNLQQKEEQNIPAPLSATSKQLYFLWGLLYNYLT